MKKSKATFLAQYCVALCALLFMGAATRANAQVPGPHPGYLHALGDLRTARNVLGGRFTDPRHAQAASAATVEINRAIADLKHAAHADDKDFNGTPAPNNNVNPSGRLHTAMDNLKMARSQAGGLESDPATLPIQASALNHIDAAIGIVVGVLQ